MRLPTNKTKTLKRAVEEEGPLKVSKQLGVTSGAVTQMVQSGRLLFVRKIDGLLHYCDVKEWKRGDSD